MDAASYMREIVEPTIGDFELNPASRRHAFLACVTTFHCLDYLGTSRSSGNARDQFRRENRDFSVVDRVAHAFKHVTSGDARAANNLPLKIEDVVDRAPARWDEAVWDQARWDDEQGGVEIAGEMRDDLVHVAKRAAEFLRTKI